MQDTVYYHVTNTNNSEEPGDDTQGNVLNNVAGQCCHQRQTETGPMTDLNYPDRNVLPIFNGKVLSNNFSADCPTTLLKKLPCVSSPLLMSHDCVTYFKLFIEKKHFVQVKYNPM